MTGDLLVERAHLAAAGVRADTAVLLPGGALVFGMTSMLHELLRCGAALGAPSISDGMSVSSVSPPWTARSGSDIFDARMVRDVQKKSYAERTRTDMSQQH